MNSYQVITNQIIELLEKGTVPWRKSWFDGPSTRSYHGRKYRGINFFLLSGLATLHGLRGCWMTFNQIKKLGGHVKKGAKGVHVVYWRWIDDKDDEDEKSGRSFPICRVYTVFSICQTEGIEEPGWISKLIAKRSSMEPIKAAEDIWNGYPNKPALTHGGDESSYSPAADRISMPSPDCFTSPEDFFNTLYHEAVHSSGHISRLNRPGVSDRAADFGSETYSREELIAELGAAFLCEEAGIGNDQLIGNSAAYIDSWIQCLKEDSKLVVLAGAQAQKAADHILGRKSSSADCDPCKREH
jgi:antirestriction protein ArdC